MKFLSSLLWLVIYIYAIIIAPIVLEMALSLAKSVYILLGIITFIFLYYFSLKEKLVFFQNLDHELSHILLNLCFFNKIIELHVHNRMGGHVIYNGRGHVLISLAPYFLRIPMLIIVFLSLLIQHTLAVNILYYLAGIIFTYSYFSIWQEARPYQSDLTQNGLFFSYITIIALNIISFGILISIFLKDTTLIKFSIQLLSKLFI